MGSTTATRSSLGVSATQDERREADTTVVRLEPSRVEPARPVARLDGDRLPRRALPRPVDPHRLAHLEPDQLVVSQARVGPVPDAQERQREGRHVGEHLHRHPLGREVRAAGERGLDPEHVDDRGTRALGARRAAPAVDAAPALSLDRDAHHVGADRDVVRRRPGNLVSPGPERRFLRPADAARPDPRSHGIEPYACAAAEPEQDARSVSACALG